ncbi:helix-turn-helix domain-containing protein [Amycolatopsis sp. NPDC048633]|uniref:helix-turn-helix domain-containing protein n=1 Tax=Amycolatopsis sp. NPDC048633 TaxID=3157095 RepID=UPI0033FEE3C5
MRTDQHSLSKGSTFDGPHQPNATPDDEAAPPAKPAPLLYTPAAAAGRLTIGESWLRRKAGQRLIPCTFVGKHLRFTEDDLRAIVAAGRRGPSNRDQSTRPGHRRRSRR